MFAVIKTGGKQYRVAANDVIQVGKLAGEAGQAVTFDALMVTGDNGTQIGSAVAGVTVTGEVVEQTRGPKVIAFKKRRRQNSKRKRGHRQDITVVRITAIGGATGEKPKAKRTRTKTAQEGDAAPADTAPAAAAQA